MTIKEAIRRIRNYIGFLYGTKEAQEEICEALNMAVTALREKQERENPLPLTYEELLKLHGEPVYVTVPGKPHRSKWCIVDLISPQPGLLGKEYFCPILVAATPAVKIYRHKPKEEHHG